MMLQSSTVPRWRALAGALGALALLAACAGTGAPAAAPAGAGRDHVTASDEPDATKRARVRLELAGAYFGRGQMTTALDEVKLSIAADPNIGAAYNLRGLIYASLGDDALADESFRRALQLDSRDADAMQNYGWYMCQRKRYDDAQAMFDQALTVPQYPDTPRTLLTKGICQARAGQWEQAEKTLQRSYELDPANPTTGVNLAEVLFRRGEFERARFYIRRVNSTAEFVSPSTLWLAARIENKLGNQQGTQEFGRRLRDRFPQSREARTFDQGRFDD